jgi:hypothetical protein
VIDVGVEGVRIELDARGASAGDSVLINGVGLDLVQGPFVLTLDGRPVTAGRIVVDGAGTFRTEMVLPGDLEPGEHIVALVAVDRGEIVAATRIAVVAAPPIEWWVLAAAALVVVVLTGLWLLARRRRRAVEDPAPAVAEPLAAVNAPEPEPVPVTAALTADPEPTDGPPGDAVPWAEVTRRIRRPILTFDAPPEAEPLTPAAAAARVVAPDAPGSTPPAAAGDDAATGSALLAAVRAPEAIEDDAGAMPTANAPETMVPQTNETTVVVETEVPVPAEPVGWMRLDLAGGPLEAATVVALVSWNGELWSFGHSAESEARPLAGVWSSPDGNEWREVARFGHGTLHDVVVHDGGIIAYGSRVRDDLEAVAWVWSSTTGAEWEPLAEGHDGDPDIVPAAAAAYHGLVLLAGSGDDDAMWIGNARGEWVRIGMPGGVGAIARLGDSLVALGRYASLGGTMVLRSDTGLRWTEVEHSAEAGLDRLAPIATAVADGRLVVIGTDVADDGAAVWSTRDAVAWDRVELPGIAQGASPDLVITPRGWFAAGGSGDGVLVWRSIDGEAWEPLGDEADIEPVRSPVVAEHNDRIYVAGTQFAAGAETRAMWRRPLTTESPGNA